MKIGADILPRAVGARSVVSMPGMTDCAQSRLRGPGGTLTRMTDTSLAGLTFVPAGDSPSLSQIG